MPKKPTKPSDTEIVPKGELSLMFKLALKQAGEKITEEHIGQALNLADETRRSFTVNAVCLGLLLLAKKEAIPHGKFKAFCEKALTQNGQNGHFEGQSYRSARRYMALAKRLLLQLQTPDPYNEIGVRILALAKQGDDLSPAEVLGIVTGDNQQSVVEFLNAVFSKLSFDDLRKHLNESAKAADEELDTPDRDRPTRSHDEAQTDFFHALQEDIQLIQDRIDAPEFKLLDRKEIKGYAQKLIEQGKKILSYLDGEPTASE